MRKLIYILICAIAIWYMLHSVKSDSYYRNLRIKFLERADKVNIAVLWPFKKRKDFYKEGALIAQKEINKHGGVIGKKLYLEFYSYDTIEEGVKKARKIAKNRKYSAVIGFYQSSLTLKASVTCEMSGLLLLSSGAVDSKITAHRFHFIFRNMANIISLSNAVIHFIKDKKIKKFSIIYNTKDVSRNIMRYISEFADELDVNIASSAILPLNVTNYRDKIAKLKEIDPDALFFAISRKQAINFVKQMKELDFRKPIIATDTVDDEYFIKELGKLSEGVITYSMFNPNVPNKSVKEFISNFRKNFGKEPDVWAALGYDAIKAICFTMNKVKSITPIAVVPLLPYIKISGALGDYSFNIHGDIVNKKIYFKKIHNGKFVYLEESYGTN